MVESRKRPMHMELSTQNLGGGGSRTLIDLLIINGLRLISGDSHGCHTPFCGRLPRSLAGTWRVSVAGRARRTSR